ncbi:MAG: hypothetical protein JKX97_00515 [Candidatus Lindowbacteria bacterium]|nr:hypothetical protein [Candidatus Lindowbacteria bacterium]
MIDELMIKAKEVINDEFISIEFISNEQFYSEIVDPLIENTDDEHDTAELFSRAIKLLKLDNRKESPKPIVLKKQTKSRVLGIKKEINGMKIGQFAQYSFRKAFEQGLISESEINRLQNPDYSKATFDINYEILKNKNRNIKDEKGRMRYYAREIFCENYHLTNHWVESHWDLLLNWLNKIGFKYK